MALKIGSVPYLNAKPLVDYFHSSDCKEDVEVIYEVPSKLAKMLRSGEVDVANCSIFECLSAPGLKIVPGVSISSDGPVMSVRLFSKVNIECVETVALDTSSLTSAALTRILLDRECAVTPSYLHSSPDLDHMLKIADAGLIIGDLKLFDLQPETIEYDLGEAWQHHMHLPFVYAAWQTPAEKASAEMTAMLNRAMHWGMERLEPLANRWSVTMNLPYERCVKYFNEAMIYGLDNRQIQGLELYRSECARLGLIPDNPLPEFSS